MIIDTTDQLGHPLVVALTKCTIYRRGARPTGRRRGWWPGLVYWFSCSFFGHQLGLNCFIKIHDWYLVMGSIDMYSERQRISPFLSSGTSSSTILKFSSVGHPLILLAKTHCSLLYCGMFHQEDYQDFCSILCFWNNSKIVQ